MICRIGLSSFYILVMVFGLASIAMADDNSKGIVVWNLEAQIGVEDKEVTSLSGIISREVARQSGLNVISEADIATIIRGNETRQRCDLDDSTCYTEIGAALGVPEAVSGDLSHFGNTWVLNIRRINIRTAEVTARVSRQFQGEIEKVIRLLPGSVAELFGVKSTEDMDREESIIVWRIRPRRV